MRGNHPIQSWRGHWAQNYFAKINLGNQPRYQVTIVQQAIPRLLLSNWPWTLIVNVVPLNFGLPCLHHWRSLFAIAPNVAIKVLQPLGFLPYFRRLKSLQTPSLCTPEILRQARIWSACSVANVGAGLYTNTSGDAETFSVKGGCLEGLSLKEATHIWCKRAIIDIPRGALAYDEEPPKIE